MRCSVHRAAQAAWAVWGDNFGETTDLFTDSAESRAQFAVRIGVATITAARCRFSHFPGVVRHHMVLQGASKLTVDGVEHELLSSAEAGVHPVCVFDGGAQTECEIVSQPLVVLNAMAGSRGTIVQFESVRAANELCFAMHASDGSKRTAHVLYVASGTVSIRSEMPASTLVANAVCEELSAGDWLVAVLEPGDVLERIQVDFHQGATAVRIGCSITE